MGKQILLLLLSVGLCATAAAQSSGMQSDWMELVKGHRDDRMGAEVRDVMTDPSTGHHSVMVSVPKVSLTDPAMEEVVVTGKAPVKAEMPELFPELETQWVDDYDNDNYGLLVKLKSDQKMPFRLFFNAEGQGGSIDNGIQQP